MAMDTDGDFVVVWDSLGSFGTASSSDSIQGQHFASDGSIVGGEFQINTFGYMLRFTDMSAFDTCY